MNKLEKTLTELFSYTEFAGHINPKVSAVSVGWHIEHSMLVVLKSIRSLSNSNPDQYRSDFNLIRFILLSLNRFPRGRGKAPDVVKPKEHEPSDLNLLYEKTKAAIEELGRLEDRQFFKHPVFGQLNRKNTIKFLEIHGRHHLSIIKDMVSKSKDSGKSSF